MCAIGRVYREQRGEGRPASLVQQAVTSESLHKGFAREAYRTTVSELLPQLMALPNVAGSS